MKKTSSPFPLLIRFGLVLATSSVLWNGIQGDETAFNGTDTENVLSDVVDTFNNATDTNNGTDTTAEEQPPDQFQEDATDVSNGTDSAFNQSSTDVLVPIEIQTTVSTITEDVSESSTKEPVAVTVIAGGNDDLDSIIAERLQNLKKYPLYVQQNFRDAIATGNLAAVLRFPYGRNPNTPRLTTQTTSSSAAPELVTSTTTGIPETTMVPIVTPTVLSTTMVSTTPITTVTVTVPASTTVNTTVTLSSTTKIPVTTATTVTTTTMVPSTTKNTTTTPTTTTSNITAASTTTTVTTTNSPTTRATTGTTISSTHSTAVTAITARTTVLARTSTATRRTTPPLPPQEFNPCYAFSDGTIELNGFAIAGNEIVETRLTSANQVVNVTSYAFIGLRYGKAKRFQIPTTNVDHTDYTLTTRPLAGYQCPQSGNDQPMSEDCLFIDVYVPSSVKTTGPGDCTSNPVILFIHGGAYRSGSKDLYDAMDLANAMDTVVVIPNYRLGVFGFLSTEDKTATGNWGLHDLKLALKWTNINVANFGGNPGKITLIGHSTGAALVSMMMLDPDNRVLVHNVVTMSGSSLAPWAMARGVKSSTVKLAQKLKCPASPPEVMVTCLKTKTAGELLGMAARLRQDSPTGFVFGPVVDGILLTATPAKILASASWKLSGSFTNGFMAHDAAVLMSLDQIWQNSGSRLSKLLVEWFQQVAFPESLQSILDCKSPPTYMMKNIYAFYEMVKSKSRSDTRNKLIQVATDALFVVPAVKEAAYYADRKLAAAGNTLYNISYNDNSVYKSLPSISGSIIGSSHAMDVAFLFGRPVASHLVISIMAGFDSGTSHLRDLLRHILQNKNMTNSILRFSSANATYLSLESTTGWLTKRKDLSKLLSFWGGVHTFGC
ncbi:putative Liver carboxylesterase 1 [Hypsibius exemplaris]|uniref:Liver carboxylesterase 1 n=1 Tax=Hypsibius exemplaris TaxID=2072580 RepID=A0A9X6NAY1_HYPEX|nr:putative Liver carboxylesterase 1 [Hypsibius exemplaris]